MRGVNEVAMPPWRMNVPSCTVRTRSTFGLNVMVSVMTDTRDALLIEMGTVYGPPATWKVVPGTVTITCAGVAGVPPGPVGAAGTASGGGAVGAGVPGATPGPVCGVVGIV